MKYPEMWGNHAPGYTEEVEEEARNYELETKDGKDILNQSCNFK